MDLEVGAYGSGSGSCRAVGQGSGQGGMQGAIGGDGGRDLDILGGCVQTEVQARVDSGRGAASRWWEVVRIAGAQGGIWLAWRSIILWRMAAFCAAISASRSARMRILRSFSSAK